MKIKYFKIICLIIFTLAANSGFTKPKRPPLRSWKKPSYSTKAKTSYKSTTVEDLNPSNTKKTSINSKSSTSEKIKILLSVLKKDPANPSINNRLGYLYYSTKKYKQAEYYYKKGIAYNAKNIQARLGLYLLATANKDYNKAAAYCREVRRIDNLNYYGNLYYTYARMAQYKYKSAETTCKKMLTVYPCDTTFLRLLKLNYTYQKQTSKAQQIQTKLDILK